MNAKAVKMLISNQLTDRKKGISVALGECDDQYERILVKYPRDNHSYVSLNPIQKILKKYNFYVAQIINFWFDDKILVLLIREPKS